MSKSIKTRTKYRIVGSDYSQIRSAQEPRMTGFLSEDPKIREAYTTGKDLYAIIAQSAFHNDYYDNLEFYREFSKVDIDGKTIIAGSEKEYEKETVDNALVVPKCYLIETDKGEVPVESLTVNDKVKADIGLLMIERIEDLGEQDVNGMPVDMAKVVFREV